MARGKTCKAHQQYPELQFHSASEWKAWLKDNHRSSKGVWLVFWNKRSGKGGITHRQALEEALCYGWIDSLIHKLDDERYAIVFTPRKAGSIWSDINLGLVRKLVAEGRMTKEGLDKVDWSQEGQEGRWTKEVPPDLTEALSHNPEASKTFDSLTPKQMAMHVYYVLDAKRPETRSKRIDRIVALLAAGKRLGIGAESQNK